jgi:hypothetical protein
LEESDNNDKNGLSLAPLTSVLSPASNKEGKQEEDEELPEDNKFILTPLSLPIDKSPDRL